MRFTGALHTRVTATLHARARYKYMNKRGERISASYTNFEPWRHDFMHRLVDPAHDRWFLTRENLDATFEWNRKTIFQTLVGFSVLFSLYYVFRDMVDRANIVERGVTLKQIEREHAEVFTFEPFMTEFAAFATKVPKHHDWTPVHTGRYRQDHRA